MRRVISIAVVSMLVIASHVEAAESRRTSKPVTSAATRPAVRTIRGEIKSVNIETKAITVAVLSRGSESEMIVQTDERTVFELDGAQVTLVDLRAGMPVAIQIESGPALRVSAKPAPRKLTPRK